MGSSSSSSFCVLAESGLEVFLTLPPGHAIIDPGASQDLIGLKSFERLTESLNRNGLRPIKLDEIPAPASGIGGDARPLFCALSPCVLGGKPGIIKLTVVSDDVPQLLSVGLLEHAGAIIDVPRNQIQFQNFGTSADMNRLSSGDRTLNISSWNGEPFPVPQQLRDQFQLSADAFNLADAQVSRDYAAVSFHEHALELSVHEVMRYARKGQSDSKSIAVPFGLIICCDVDSFLISDPFSSHQYADVRYCTSWLVEPNERTCALLETSREVGQQASDQVRKHVLFRLESKSISDESYVVCLLSSSPVVLLITDNIALSSEVSRTQASYQSSCSKSVTDVSSVDARRPTGKGSVRVVRHDAATSDAAEGANQSGTSIGISTDATDRRGCDNSSTTAQGVSSSSGSHGQGWQSTWLLEDMRPLQQANDLQEVGAGQSSPESAGEQEDQECHHADLCEHGASSSDPALSTSAEFRGAHHNARCSGTDLAADGPTGSVDCWDGLAGHGPYDGDNAADGSQSSAASDHGSGSTAADRTSPSAAWRSGASSYSRISSSSGDCLRRGADGSSSWRPVGDASQLSSGIRGFTNSEFHGSEVKCTDDPSWFIGKLNMAVVNYFLLHDQPCFWGVGKVFDAVGCVFYSPDLCRELRFGDCSEHREFQVPRRVKRSIHQSSEQLLSKELEKNSSSSSKLLHEQFAAFCHKANQLMDGNSSGSNSDESESKETAQTASHAAKARTARKGPNGDEQTASQAAKARTARKDPNGDDQTASHAAKARTARKEDQDQEQLNDHDHGTAAISNLSPERLSFSSPSPCWLSSVGSQFGMENDERLQRFRMCLHNKKTYKVMELFSPPRVSERARQVGFSTTSPAAFDLKTGWNVLDAKDRAEFWKVVHEQKPDCILMTPDCRPFSSMMQSNWSRMTETEVQRIQQEGLIMWHFCVQVAEHQISQNKEFCIEQPGFASSAQTHATEWLLQQPGVVRFLFDQCMTGLKVKRDEPSRKTTALTTNHLGLAAVFSSLQCTGDHSHVPLEGGLPAKAAIFGTQLIETFIRGLSFKPELSFFGDDEEEEGDLENALDAEIEASGAREPPARGAPHESVERLTSEQKKKVNQVHLNLGHLSREQMLSLFKAAGAKQAVMRYVKEEYNCEHCMRQRRPIDRKKATMQRTFAFNRQVGIDTFYISWGGRTHAYLNVVCQGTNYQQVCWLRDYDGGAPSSKVAWQAFCQCWLKPYGLPEMVISDGGPEFKDVFERSLEQLNILQLVCDAASPWQNGRVERHGGWVKERAEMELSSGQSIITSSEELDELLTYVVTHKNRWFSRGGFSPCQLVFGINPTLPADLLGDSPQDLAWQDIEADAMDQDTAAMEFNRSHRIRQRARELCVQQSAANKVRLSSLGRPHRQRQWAQGQWVYVWRKTVGTGQGHLTRSRWMGPGLVILQAGHTVYVSMRSRLWKCNSDQLRAATHHEALGASLTEVAELKDLLLQGRQSRCGAVDVAAEGSPPSEAENMPVPSSPDRTVPSVLVPRMPSIPEEDPDQHRPGPGAGHVLRQEVVLPLPTQVSQRNTSRAESEVGRLSNQSHEEPFGEPLPDKRRKTSLDTIGGASSSSSASQDRVKRRVSELEELENKRLEREALKELKRINKEARREGGAPATPMTNAPATPRVNVSAAPSTPATPRMTSRPITPRTHREGQIVEESCSPGLPENLEDQDDSDLFSSDPRMSQFCFLGLRPSEDRKSLLAQHPKPKNSEFDMRTASAEEKQGFEKSDAAEWQTILDMGAVRICSPEESRKLRSTLRHRIIASRMVRRKKPMPGIGNYKYKSRWCVLGHSDPDSGSLKTFSPMPCTEAIALFFQLALCLDLKMSFADVKSAFCQSNPLNRPQGPLFAEACSGLGLPKDTIVELQVPVYGLDDAPISWHHTVLEFLFSLGFERSLFEPCWLIKRINGRIMAMIMVEVDDFNIGAVPEYQDELQKLLQERFQFGKWEHDAADFAGRTVRFESDRVVMSQEKYIVEKVHQLKVPRGMLSSKESTLSSEMFEEFRSMLYRVSWLAHQTRPEAAGIVSLLSSRLHRATIHDVCCLNKLIHHIKSTASQPLVLHKFDLNKLVLIAASDAGGVSSEPIKAEAAHEELEDMVQGAWVIMASDQLPSASRRIRVSILSWRSAKLKRRVSSTLAGEALAFNQALAEVEWIQLMIRDVLHGDVHKEDWKKSVLPFITVLRSECELKSRLEQCSVTDAKSLFDAIAKESTNSRQDRRTAIEIAIILDAIRNSGSSVRWSPHPKMVADVLTKDNIAKSNGALEEVLKTSRLTIWDEHEELRLRKENPNFKLRSKKASERIRQENSCLLAVADLVNKEFGELLQYFHHVGMCS